MNGEKGASWKRISFKGTPGHGSMPYGSDNAVVKAGEAAMRLSKYEPPVNTTYLSHIAQGLGLGFIERTMLTHPLLLSFALSRMKIREPIMARIMHGLSRMTISPNLVRGGIKVNVIPETASIDVDIRTLPEQDDEYVVFQLKEALGPLADEATIEGGSPIEGGFASFGNASPPRSPFVDAMENAVRKEVPGATLVPFIMPAATDSRFLRRAGTEAYGFSLIDPETPMNHLADLAHGVNERVSIKTLELSQRVYLHLAKDFLK